MTSKPTRTASRKRCWRFDLPASGRWVSNFAIMRGVEAAIEATDRAISDEEHESVPETDSPT